MNKDQLQDIIYLVVDGEATETERSMLFSRLSTDSDLQEEFQDAIHITRNIEVEKLNAAPPLAVTTALFSKAGIPSDFLNTGSPNPVQPPVAPGPGSLLPELFRKIFINRIAGSILFFALGVVCTVVFIDLTGNKATLDGRRVSHLFDRNSAPPPSAGQPGTEATIKPGRTDRGISPERNKSMKARPFNAGSAAPAGKAEIKHDIITADNKTVSVVYAALPDRDRPLLDMRTIDDPGLIPAQIYEVLPGEEAGNMLNGISIEVKGIGGIAYLPGRQLINSQPPDMNNIAAEISYDIDQTSAIGLEGGIETYPVFVKNADNILVPTNSLAYVGGYYRLSFGSFYIGGRLVPNVKIFAGGTNTGLMLKASTGVAYYPEKMIGFVAGLENTGVFSTYNSRLNYTNKIGFYYGINIKF